MYREFVADFGTDLALYMYSYLRFLLVMSWIDEREYRKELKDVVRHLVLEGSLESYDTLRSIDYENRDFSGVIYENRDNEPSIITEREISFEELPEDYLLREGALDIIEMGFIKLKDKRIQEEMIEILEDEGLPSSLHRTASFILKKSEPSDPNILKWLVNKLEQPSVRYSGGSFDAFEVLLWSDLSHPETQKFIAKKLEDPNPYIQERALGLLEESETSDREIYKKWRRSWRVRSIV